MAAILLSLKIWTAVHFVLICGIIYLLALGVVSLAFRSVKNSYRTLCHAVAVSLGMIVAIGVIAGVDSVDDWSLFFEKHHASGTFLLLLLVGGVIVAVACKLCMLVGKWLRLWLHRRIARMSYTFAIVACGVVIAAPLVIPLVVVDSFSALHGDSAKNWAIYRYGMVKGYFHAISSDASSVFCAECSPDVAEPASDPGNKNTSGASGGRNIELHEVAQSVGLFFGLIGYLIFSGFTVSVFVEMLRSKKTRIDHGEEYYENLQNHYVVIGSGMMLESVIRSICEDEEYKARRRDIVVLSSESIVDLRKRLTVNLKEFYMERLLLVHGDRINPEDLAHLALRSCKRIYLTGDFGTADQDDRNLESLSIINSILGGNAAGTTEAGTRRHRGEVHDEERKTCRIYLERYHTFGLFQSYIKDTKLEKIDIEPVCFYKRWAEVILGVRQIKDRELGGGLHSGKGNLYTGLDHNGITADSDTFVHLVIIGMSRMGMSLATEAALLMHFPNANGKLLRDQESGKLLRDEEGRFVRDHKRIRTKITLIDMQAKHEMYKFVNLHTSLFNEMYHTYTEYEDAPLGGKRLFCEKNAESGWLDTEFHFVQGNAECENVRDCLVSYARQPHVRLTIAVCLPDARRSLTLALGLPRELYNQENTRIYVQQDVGKGMLSLLQSQNSKDCPYANVYPFGMHNVDVEDKSEPDELAMYVPLTYVDAQYGIPSWASLVEISKGQEVKKKWKAMKPWERISNYYAAASCEYKRRSFTVQKKGAMQTYEEIEADAALAALYGEVEHHRWCMEKLITGFRTLTKEEAHRLDSMIDSREKWCAEEKRLKCEIVHPGLRPWEKICEAYHRGVDYKGYYRSSINMGKGICFLKELRRSIEEAHKG